MKTSSTEFMKRAVKVSSVIIIGAFILVLARCQKEELMAPSNVASTSVSNLENKAPIAKIKVNPMIFIDHISRNSDYPDYSVTVFYNGNVIFSGRNKTSVKGQTGFHISQEVIMALKTLYDQSGLFERIEIPDQVASSGNLNKAGNANIKSTAGKNIIFDQPYVLTTYRNSDFPVGVTLNDNLAEPQNLIALRDRTESMLGILKFVYGK